MLWFRGAAVGRLRGALAAVVIAAAVAAFVVVPAIPQSTASSLGQPLAEVVLAAAVPRAAGLSLSPTPGPTSPPAIVALSPELAAALTKRLGELRAAAGIPDRKSVV